MYKQLLPEHVRTSPSCMNIGNFYKIKVTTQKTLALKLCSILDFHSEYYIPEIKKLYFHFPHVHICGENYCACKRHDMFVS